MFFYMAGSSVHRLSKKSGRCGRKPARGEPLLGGARGMAGTIPAIPDADFGPERWAARLYASAKFPDERLRGRAVKITAALAARPADSIPQACDSWDSTKATYRFIENERVRFEAIQGAVSEAAARDCAGHETILCIQDTTILSFPTARHTTGLGPVTNNPDVRGALLHSVLAARPDGVPIGLLHQHFWCRDPEEYGRSTATKNKKPIEEKESFKWLRGMRAAREALAAKLSPEVPPPRLIHVGDCENDIHEVFDDIDRAGEGMVIRCGRDRRVVGENGDGGHAFQMTRQAPLLGKRTIEVPRKHGRPARKAKVEIRSRSITLDPRSPHHPERRPLGLNLVEVWESRPPEGLKPLHWLLWTAEAVDSLEAALRVVEIYKKRWKIEEFHLVLKSGCRIEKLRFETAERIAKAVALYSPIAARIVRLRDLSRLEPEAPCTEVLSETEWRALWTYIHKKAPSRKIRPPTMRQAALWIGRIGGHLGRRGDGMPGVRTLWRGWRDLQIMVEIYSSLGP